MIDPEIQNNITMIDQENQNNTIRWYVIHAYSGFEQKVAESIKEQAIKVGLSNLIEEISVPTQEIVEVRRGT